MGAYTVCISQHPSTTTSLMDRHWADIEAETPKDALKRAVPLAWGLGFDSTMRIDVYPLGAANSLARKLACSAWEDENDGS